MPRGGWNRGLTKETDERVARNAASISKSTKGRKRNPQSEEHKANIGTSMRKYYKENPGKHKRECNAPLKEGDRRRNRKGKTYEEIYGEKKAAQMRRERSGESSDRWKPKETRICALPGCDNTFEVIVDGWTYDREYCSNECKYKALSNRYKGSGGSNWQGGISNLPYPFEFNDEFKELVRERYDHTCVICKREQWQLKRKLDVHHIDYDKDNLDPDNFVSLCTSCHMTTNANRAYWTKVLQNVVEMNRRLKSAVGLFI